MDSNVSMILVGYIEQETSSQAVAQEIKSEDHAFHQPLKCYSFW